MRERWDRVWFAPATPTNLGVCRALFFGLLLYHFWGIDFSHWAYVPRTLWEPVSFFKPRNVPGLGAVALPVFSADALWWMALAWRGALLLACVGLFTRAAMVVALVLGVYLIGLQHCFGKVTHTDAVLVFALLGMALSRAGDGWSVDRLVHRARRESHLEPPRESGEYHWPVRWVWLVLALCFFAAGVAKLMPKPGMAVGDWVFSDNLANLFIGFHYPRELPTDWSIHLAQHLWLTQALALGTVLLEVLFPFVLVSRAARWVLVPAAFAMQLGNGWLLGVYFSEFKVVYLFFVDWAWVGRRLGAAVMPRGRYSVLYDGSCGICKRTMAVFRGLDLAGCVEVLDVIADWPAIYRRYPFLDQMTCLTTMHVISPDGTVTTGYDGYRAVSRVMPLLWPTIPLLYVPPVPQVGRRVYAWVAQSRFSAGCALPDGGATEVPDAQGASRDAPKPHRP